MNSYIEQARKVLEIEALAVKKQIDGLGEEFNRACEIIQNCKGHLIVTGLGKSGHIGAKIAATFASTGTPSFFVHPTEAGHGDIGMITADDCVLGLSYSGSAREILTMFNVVKKMGVKTIAVTGGENSPMAKTADVHLHLKIEKEACPLQLAPTSSSTATLALCDAMAISLMIAKGFTENDFARSHPFGRLGKRLLTSVADLMVKGADIPMVRPEVIVQQAIFQITDKRLGMTTVVDENNRLIGIYTDGDLRRSIKNSVDCLSKPISSVMNRNYTTVKPDLQATQALSLMQNKKITSLPVIDDAGKIVGILHLHSLLEYGI
ncbi:MAG: KpsF/GutQ family sugar-phosphate isomerase [Cardiobacteriaceae bacterium]|nr:KpsF/GutQ family sugar-phosphate isomerase [Cardiobacteriaceae bacterium]